MTRCTHTTKGGALCKNNCAKGLITCYNHSSECPVCLEKLGSGGETSTLSCGHAFHSKCIDTWLMNDHRCPCCRENVQIGGHKYRPRVRVVLEDDGQYIPIDIIANHLRDMFDSGILPSTTVRVYLDDTNNIMVESV